MKRKWILISLLTLGILGTGISQIQAHYEDRLFENCYAYGDRIRYCCKQHLPFFAAENTQQRSTTPAPTTATFPCYYADTTYADNCHRGEGWHYGGDALHHGYGHHGRHH